MKYYTKAQLALRNGTEKEEVWVAYKGKIYNLTSSKLWNGGRHYEHWAGQDLTGTLDADAPHNDRVFRKFEVVGRLDTRSKY